MTTNNVKQLAIHITTRFGYDLADCEQPEVCGMCCLKFKFRGCAVSVFLYDQEEREHIAYQVTLGDHVISRDSGKDGKLYSFNMKTFDTIVGDIKGTVDLCIKSHELESFRPAFSTTYANLLIGLLIRVDAKSYTTQIDQTPELAITTVVYELNNGINLSLSLNQCKTGQVMLIENTGCKHIVIEDNEDFDFAVMDDFITKSIHAKIKAVAKAKARKDKASKAQSI